MIKSVIEEINGNLTPLALAPSQIAGLVMPTIDQTNNKTSLQLPFDRVGRMEPDNRLAWQSAHMLIGGQSVASQEWGSLSSTHYDVEMVLLGLSMQFSAFHKAIAAIESTYNVQVVGFETDSLRILQDYWQLVIDAQGKGIDPRWKAFIVRYKILGVASEDFAEFTQEIDNPQSY